MFKVNRAVPLLTLRTRALAFLLLSLFLMPGVQADDHNTLRVGGTGAALGGMELLAAAFMKAHPGSHVVVLPSLGSGGGIKALLAGKIDVAVSARPLKEAEVAEGLVGAEYVRSPLVFATKHDTAAENITLAELEQLYAGKTAVWPDGSRLRIVMRPATENDTEFLRTLSPQMDKAVEAATQNQNLVVAINDQDNAKAIEDIRGSLGVISLGQMLTEKRLLKPLALDGVEATTEALRQGKYPHAKPLFLISTSEPDATTAAFLSFVRSPEGREILSSYGNLVKEPLEMPKT